MVDGEDHFVSQESGRSLTTRAARAMMANAIAAVKAMANDDITKPAANQTMSARDDWHGVFMVGHAQRQHKLVYNRDG